ncbi:nucleoside diphosphate-linked moiety X motif 17 isoform X2 [Vidua chalybeata]|uniref:nucleoside diphosphate-linked moiety X motif 17 isoform X2 n=1 Tax=Vidua chalybeata TaxID=81927 RepID=UPI0023A7A16C|nr:nucleoside diphosphate-linked moiety X motif 17 isoform X2 [Vidua chalybeata]
MASARVLVHAQRAGAGGAAAFGQSVTGVFCPAHTDVALVSCGLERGHFLISDVPFPGSTVTVLKRPPFCPAKLGGATPGDREGQPGVAAAVAVLLEAACGHVLLTRRATTLRHFPNVWVPPGGHLEPGEELVAAGLRELAEETGLHLEPGTFSWNLLGLWESLFPPSLSWGPPRCHHIVAYLGLRSAEPRQQLQARLCLSPCEVSAVAWLEPPVLEAIAATEDGAEGSRSSPGELPATVGITELSAHGFRSSQIPTGILLRRAPAHGPDVERVSTGTKFALGRWRAGPGQGQRK